MKAAIGFAAAATLLATACVDATRSASPRTTRVDASANGLLGGLLGTLTSLLAPPVVRTTPLASDVTWSFVAGPGGATSSNATVGLTIAIPAGALSSTKTITVTALQGAPVAYKFEPHGLQFSGNVVLTQNLQGTSAASQLLPLLKGAYFATDRLTLSGGLAVVTELLAGLLNPLAQTFSFNIHHFSGYIVASGVGGDSFE